FIRAQACERPDCLDFWTGGRRSGVDAEGSREGFSCKQGGWPTSRASIARFANREQRSKSGVPHFSLFLRSGPPRRRLRRAGSFITAGGCAAPSPSLAFVKLDFLIGTKSGSDAGSKQKRPSQSPNPRRNVP